MGIKFSRNLTAESIKQIMIVWQTVLNIQTKCFLIGLKDYGVKEPQTCFINQLFEKNCSKEPFHTNISELYVLTYIGQDITC